MVDTIPSQVFPLPGYTKPIATHGGYNGGSDIFAPNGTPIVSMVSGTVEFLSTPNTAPNSGGNAIEVKGDNGLSYYYAHMRDLPLVKVGDRVSAGQPIGFVDNTGNAKSTESHLHIGIGHGISTGVGAPGGLGQNFDAVSLLKSLEVSPQANDPSIGTGTVSPPVLSYIPSVPGFNGGHAADILLNLKKALENGIDPFVWLGIVSKESGFDPNAVNPTSGACGYAQIYPCLPGLTPVQNIDEGLKRLKGFLTQCGGNINCALNLYSGGGGQSYIGDVLGRAGAIQTANPNLNDVHTGYDPNAPSPSGTPPNNNAEQCPPIELNLGPVTVPFPDVGCIIRTTVNDLQDSLALWWKQWQIEHVPNMFFFGVGFVLLIAGIVMFGAGNKDVQSTVMKAALVA